MERVIDVGNSYREWWFLTLAGAAAGLLLGGAMLFGAGHEAALAVSIAGAVASVALALAAAAIAKRRFSVQITPDGFFIRDRLGEREFTDEQVICASLSSKSNYASGEWRSTNRVFDVWVQGEIEPERFRIDHRIPIGETDPLELLIERVLGHLCDRADEALAARQPFEGEGWSLYSNELVVSKRRAALAVSLDEIAAVDVFDGDLCVWRTGNDEPAVRIPARSANAAVLHRLLRDRLALAAEPASASSPDGLGRLLFERRPGRSLAAAVWLLPIAAIGIVAGCAMAAIVRQEVEPILIGGFLGLALGLLWLVPLSQYVRLRCHEHGVARRWLWYEKRVRFSEVESFTYSAVKQYFKAIYSGTTFTLTFLSRAGGKPVKLSYARTLRNADDGLDHLRDHVSRVIAAKLAEEFGRGSAVAWTDSLRLFADGLEHRASGFLGKKAPVFVAYDRILAVDITDGVFQLWVDGQKKPIVKEQVSQPNFFPGYLFLTRLLASRQGTEVGEAVHRA